MVKNKGNKPIKDVKFLQSFGNVNTFDAENNKPKKK